MEIYRAKKNLGQNFLKSSGAIQKIIEVGEISAEDIILEIGPGKGILTEKLLEKAKLVIAVEKDRELFEFLKIKFEKELKIHTLILVCEDILKFDLEKELPKFFSGPRKQPPDHLKNLEALPYKIVANIPYNITGAILKKFLTAKPQPERMILMVQKEVAQRIVASDKKESILSISVKAYGEAKMIAKVPARYFSPVPKVDSAVIAIKNISRNFFDKSNKNNAIEEDKFWKIVKAGFAHKRKKLSGNLKNVCSTRSLEPFADKRAEDLALLDWISIARQN